MQQGQNVKETSLNDFEILPHKHAHNTEPFTYTIMFTTQTYIRRGGIAQQGKGDRCASRTVKDKDPFLTDGDVTVPVAMLATFWSILLHPYT